MKITVKSRCFGLMPILIAVLTLCCILPVEAKDFKAQFPEELLSARLKKISEKSGATILFDPQLIGNTRIPSLIAKSLTVEQALERSLSGTSFIWRKTAETSYAIIKKSTNLQSKKVQGKGVISGKIIDENGEGIPGVNIRFIGTTLGVITDINGFYKLTIPAGTYQVEISTIGYQKQKITDVEIKDGKTTNLSTSMRPSNNQLDDVVVTASFKKASVNSLYLTQKNSAGVTNGISAEQIARTPDKNIGETLKRVSGVNVQDNKYVVVRGLGERYNGTMMNGQVMPSTELNRKQFSFDIIPTTMVDNVTIYKTLTPDKSAEFGGGLIEVNTKNIPSENSFSITIGENYNDKTTGKNFRAQKISKSSYFGSTGSDRTLLGRTDWKNGDDIRAYYTANGSDAKLFSNNWRLYNYTPLPSPNLQASLGRVINLKNNDQIGIITSISYRNTWQTSDVLSGRNGYTGNDQNDELYGFTGKRYGFTTNLGGIVGIGYTGKLLKVSLQSIYLRTYDQQLLLGTGSKDDFGQAVGYYDQTTQTTMLQNQLKGEKTFGSRGIKLNWLGSYTILDREKPDNHQMDANYFGSSTDSPDVTTSDFSIMNAQSNLSQGVMRSWSRSYEKNLSWDLDLTVPVKFDVLKTIVNNSLKAGYAGWSKDRLFWVITTASNFATSDPQPLSEVFDQTLHPTSTIEINKFGDDYHKKAALHAGYMMLDSRIGDKLRLTAGVRGEYYDMNSANTLLENFVRIQREQNNDVTDYSDVFGLESKFNLFPSTALTYALTKQMNLRLSYAKSIIRPDLRELSYFKEYDFELGGTYQSSSPIRSTKIHNFDFRYEWYPSAGEIFSLSLFYKDLDYPMEIFGLGNRQYELRNDLSAKNKGIELEARKSFAFTKLPVLRNFTLYANFTRLYAKVTPMTVNYVASTTEPNKIVVMDVAQPEVERPQAGASNYTFNAGAYYDAKPFSLSMNYNYISNRVFRASEVYKESLFETPLPSLDGQIAVNILKNKGLLKFNVSNILNESSKVYRKRQGDNATTLFYEKGDFIDYQSTPGRTYGISFNYNF